MSSHLCFDPKRMFNVSGKIHFSVEIWPWISITQTNSIHFLFDAFMMKPPPSSKIENKMQRRLVSQSDRAKANQRLRH